MRKNNYFINNMSPSAHIFLVRNIFHHHNEKKERQTIEKMKRNVRNVSITLDTLGKAVAAPQTSMGTQTSLEPTRNLAGTTPDRETFLCDIQPQRSCWGLKPSPPQKNMLKYVLDPKRNPDETIIRTQFTKVQQVTLQRRDFLTLGLARELEATIANCCFQIITQIAQSQQNDVYAVDCYVVPTWLPPHCPDTSSFPNDLANKDFVLIPIWKPGHYMLCVLKLRERHILFLDSLFHKHPEASVGFGDQRYIQICSDLAQRIIPGEWTVIYSKDLKGLPRQKDGNACGIFMLMYALYIVLGADFDFTTADMDTIRTWWCLLLLSGHSIGTEKEK
ncbi:uncharacterized protein LOC118494780 [Sander lucioperca]|uniref:uncharacterized protein LOC118494780 n=1 Tax=Sander lucioperca TaxID=283035 RepID=UPI001653A1F2|nr:uncharacterized protein LOC118494780 [Sander lucioperca]